jgi:hypothetical protein
VCILVYDITNPKSLERLEQWKRVYEESMPSQADATHTVFGVFANKVRPPPRQLAGPCHRGAWR